MQIGKYRIYYWDKLSVGGHSGWVVDVENPNGGLGEVISKHETKKGAIAAAKRYIEVDERRKRIGQRLRPHLKNMGVI